MSRLFEGRTRARAQAIQLLFQAHSKGLSVSQMLEQGSYLLADADNDAEDVNNSSFEPAVAYAQELARGVEERQADIDRLLSAVSANWSLGRMLLVDREVMAVAIYEMFDVEDVAVAVALNEAVEISKVYGTDDSSSFVNGILGKIYRLSEANPGVVWQELHRFAGSSTATAGTADTTEEPAEEPAEAPAESTASDAPGAVSPEAATQDQQTCTVTMREDV